MQISEDLLERTLMTIRLVLDQANMDWCDLTRVILVGGSTSVQDEPSDASAKRPLKKLTRKAKPRSESGSGGWKGRRRRLAPGDDEAT